MVCDSCKIGIKAGCSCFHCSEIWQERALKEFKRNPSDKNFIKIIESVFDDGYDEGINNQE